MSNVKNCHYKWLISSDKRIVTSALLRFSARWIVSWAKRIDKRLPRRRGPLELNRFFWTCLRAVCFGIVGRFHKENIATRRNYFVAVGNRKGKSYKTYPEEEERREERKSKSRYFGRRFKEGGGKKGKKEEERDEKKKKRTKLILKKICESAGCAKQWNTSVMNVWERRKIRENSLIDLSEAGSTKKKKD